MTRHDVDRAKELLPPEDSTELAALFFLLKPTEPTDEESAEMAGELETTKEDI